MIGLKKIGFLVTKTTSKHKIICTFPSSMNMQTTKITSFLNKNYFILGQSNQEIYETASMRGYALHQAG